MLFLFRSRLGVLVRSGDLVKGMGSYYHLCRPELDGVQ